MAKRRPESTTQHMLPARAVSKKEPDGGSKRQKVRDGQNIVSERPSSPNIVFSVMMLELLIPFLIDRDILKLRKVSPVIAETMKSLYSTTIFLHSEKVFEFMKLIQKFYSCPLRLPPPGLTPWKFHEIITYPEKCCRCSQPTLKESRSTSRESGFFNFCTMCSMKDWNLISAAEVFQPMETTRAHGLLQGFKVPEPLRIRINRESMGISKAGKIKLSSGKAAYFKFGIDWILRDNPSLADNAKERSEAVSTYSFTDSVSPQARASLKSVLSLAELPAWVDNHFLMEQLSMKKLKVGKDADFIREAFNASSALYAWVQTALANLHKQTEKFVDVKTLLDASMGKNLQQLKDNFVAKALCYSNILFALEKWGEPLNSELLYDLENRHLQNIPDVIFQKLPDMDTRAVWLRQHAAELDMPSDLLNYFSRTAASDIMSHELCLADASWRWKGLSELLGEEERKSAMKHYPTQRWIFGLNPHSQKRHQVAMVLRREMALVKELAEFDELAYMKFETRKEAEAALENARCQRKIGDAKSKLLDELPPEVRIIMNRVYFGSQSPFARQTYMMTFKESSSVTLAKAIINTARRDYEQFRALLQSLTKSDSLVAESLVKNTLLGGNFYKPTMESVLKSVEDYLKSQKYSWCSSPEIMQAIIQDVYPDEYQRFVNRYRISSSCKALNCNLTSISTLLQNQPEFIQSRIRRAAYYAFYQYSERPSQISWDFMSEVIKVAQWENKSLPRPDWVSPKLLATLSRKVCDAPQYAACFLAKEQNAYTELKAAGKEVGMIDARFNVVLPTDAQKWFKAHDHARSKFLSQLRAEERKWKYSRRSVRNGLPPSCIQRLKTLGEMHWRGYFEAIDQLELESKAVSIMGWVERESKECKSRSMTPDIQNLIADGYFDLAARRLGFYVPSSSHIAKTKNWDDSYYRGIH